MLPDSLLRTWWPTVVRGRQYRSYAVVYIRNMRRDLRRGRSLYLRSIGGREEGRCTKGSFDDACRSQALLWPPWQVARRCDTLGKFHNADRAVRSGSPPQPSPLTSVSRIQPSTSPAQNASRGCIARGRMRQFADSSILACSLLVVQARPQLGILPPSQKPKPTEATTAATPDIISCPSRPQQPPAREHATFPPDTRTAEKEEERAPL